MAVSKPPVQLQEELLFRPRWWWDPVPDWVLTHIPDAAIRELAVIQMETQRAVLEVHQGALERAIGVLKKASK